MDEWKRADAALGEARERLSRALLGGAQSEQAEKLHREVLSHRAAADKLLADLLDDLKQRSQRRF